MPIESIATLVVLFLIGLVFCKALEFIVERARSFGHETAVSDLLRNELRILHIKVDAVWKNLDDVKIELNEIKTKLESTAAMTEQLIIVPASPTTVHEAPEDTWERGEFTPLHDELVTTASTIEQSTSEDTWTRDAGVYWTSKVVGFPHRGERPEEEEGGQPRLNLPDRKGQSRRRH